MMSIKEILSAPLPFTGFEFQGTLAEVYTRRSGQSRYGNWSFQNILVQDNSGKIIVTLEGRPEIASSEKGKTFIFRGKYDEKKKVVWGIWLEKSYYQSKKTGKQESIIKVKLSSAGEMIAVDKTENQPEQIPSTVARDNRQTEMIRGSIAKTISLLIANKEKEIENVKKRKEVFDYLFNWITSKETENERIACQVELSAFATASSGQFTYDLAISALPSIVSAAEAMMSVDYPAIKELWKTVGEIAGKMNISNELLTTLIEENIGKDKTLFNLTDDEALKMIDLIDPDFKHHEKEG